jgi:RND family efflux transporter MFP subunit
MLRPTLMLAVPAVLVLAGMRANAADDAAPVTVVTAERAGLARTLRLTATVTAERSAALSPRVSGLVAAVHVDAGDEVRAGKVLIELDRDLAQLAQQRAKAALEEARAQLAEADRLYGETQQLVERRLVPETRLPAAEAERRVASAAVQRLEADYRHQTELLERHAVVAPFAGVISAKRTEVGEWVETGTPVVDLVDTRRLRLDVQVPQERYHDVVVGTPAVIHLDALPGRSLSGRVAARVPVSDPSARAFLARISVRDPDRLLTPGMSAQVSFELRDSGGPAVTLPRDALVRHPDGTSAVWVVSGDAPVRVSERRVELGRSSAGSVEIVSGLNPGTRVVLRGNETLKEGQSVRIVQPAEAQR